MVPADLEFVGCLKVSRTFASNFNEIVISAVMQIRFVHDTDSIYCKHQSTTGKKLLAAL